MILRENLYLLTSFDEPNTNNDHFKDKNLFIFFKEFN